MQIQLNGETKEVAKDTTLAGLVAELGLEGSRYAIEVNEELVPRSEHARHALREGDRVEVVQAIGGG